MSLKSRLTLGTALIAALAGAPALAVPLYFDVEVPGVGAGTFAYDYADLQAVGGGLYTSALIEFSFQFNGSTFGLGDAAVGPLAWFSDPAVEPTGIQYLGTHASDTIEFAAGFGSGDMGTFTANGGAPTGVGPITLTDADFVQQAPEPATLACLLLGIGLMSGARRRGWHHVSW